ncbi:hypothetical protein GBA52_028066 [Prunus armeniaca]|nr:hypothetical protein GBA52_028066 [Prunus armeniaca]
MLSSSSDCSTSLLDDLDINLRAKRRWRMAYLALRVVRVMLELPKEIISRASNYEGDDETVHYSFVSNSEHDEDAGLKEMAKEKELATALSDHGGLFTAGLATSDYTKSHYDYGKLLHDITTITFTRAKKRWRMAFAAIYAVRAMLSLPKEIVAKRNNYKHHSEIFHSFSHTAPDIELSTALDLKPRTKSQTDAYGFVPNPDFDHAGLTTMLGDQDKTSGIRAWSSGRELRATGPTYRAPRLSIWSSALEVHVLHPELEI